MRIADEILPNGPDAAPHDERADDASPVAGAAPTRAEEEAGGASAPTAASKPTSSTPSSTPGSTSGGDGPSPDADAKDASSPTAPTPRRRSRAGEIATVIIGGLAIVYTLYFARSFFVPIALALLFALLLWPLVHGLKRRVRIPEPVGAFIVVAALVGATVVGFQYVVAPANDWLRGVPATVDKLERRLAALKRSFERVRETTEHVGQLASPTGSKEEKPTTVVAATPSLGDRIFQGAVEGAIAIASAIVLLYFFLASGDLFLRKLVRVVPRLRDKIRAVEIATEIRVDIGKYLRTITFINIGVGIAVGLGMWTLDMPQPVVWGVLSALFNFVPYLGALTIEVATFLVASSIYDGISAALVPPAVVLAIHILESQLVTPYILGRALTLNPVVVLVALLLWGWLWGIAGVILAVPILIGLRIAADHVESLAAVGEFLSEK